jgi:hypothetical protein
MDNTEDKLAKQRAKECLFTDSSPCVAEVLVLEAFYDGSHKQMIDTVLDGVDKSKYLLLTMSGKKWHWRARTSGLHFQQKLWRVTGGKYKFVFTPTRLREHETRVNKEERNRPLYNITLFITLYKRNVPANHNCLNYSLYNVHMVLVPQGTLYGGLTFTRLGYGNRFLSFSANLVTFMNSFFSSSVHFL